jgi:hypothetical protein
VVAVPERRSLAGATAAAAESVALAADRLLERPRAVLATLAGVQVAATLALALSVERNGWVWFQGGDQIWSTTTGALVGRLELPPTEVGYVWPLVLAPFTWVTGPTFVNLLPPLVVGQVLVLGPLALLLVYGIAAQVGGRLLGYWASFLWVVAPYAAIPMFFDRYQERWTDTFLPQALGLTAMSDFPSLVVVLAAAYFVLRSLRPGRVADAALAGLLLGAAGGLKPPNLLLGVGAALAFLVARRWREGVVFGAAVAPALLVLALWKERGLGTLPLFSLEQARIAAGAGLVALEVDLGRYLDVNVDHWRGQMAQLREFFWSARIAQFVPFAGLLAVLRVRREAAAVLLAGWLAAFLVIKGFSPRAEIQSGSFWRLLLPAWPAYLLLFASIPLLVPTFARRLGSRLDPPETRPVRGRWLALVAVATLLVPAGASLAAAPTDGPARAVVRDDVDNFVLTAVDESVELRAERTAEGVRLTWTPGSWRASVFFRVYRSDDGSDVECEHTEGARAAYCYVREMPMATTRETEYLDASAPPGASYRVGVAANWLDDAEQGDVFAFSPPARAAPPAP